MAKSIENTIYSDIYWIVIRGSEADMRRSIPMHKEAFMHLYHPSSQIIVDQIGLYLDATWPIPRCHFAYESPISNEKSHNSHNSSN